MGHHQKRMASPRSWSVSRKAFKWIVKSAPGAHRLQNSLPLLVVVRDFLKLTETNREARRVIGAGDILVDGRPQKDYKAPVGYFDVISIPKIKKHFRVLVDHRSRITVNPIDEKESGWKLARVENKSTVKGGLTQLNLHDGRNILVVKDTYKTGDTLKIALPSQEIQGSVPFKPGSLCLVTGGRHAGEVASLDAVEVKRLSGENLVTLTRGETVLRTVKSYVFPIGAKKSEVSLPAGVISS